MIKSLEMKGCYVIAHNPSKENLYYEVADKCEIDSVIAPVISCAAMGRGSDRLIIFCRTYDDTSVFYERLMLQLVENCTLIKDSDLNIHNCEKFTACTASSTKKSILKSFTDPNGVVRIVVATVAFGMGLDSPNVRHIVHWGPPEDLELYVQETGRGGRDGHTTKCVLYFSPKDFGGTSHISPDMKTYCENTVQCRRNLLMRQFTEEQVKSPEYLHLCCDICATVCTCSVCETYDADNSTGIPSQQSLSPVAVNPIVQEELKRQILAYRSMLFQNTTHATSLVGYEVCSGLTQKTVNAIVDNYPLITSEADLLSFGVSSVEYCTPIMNIVRKYTNP